MTEDTVMDLCSLVWQLISHSLAFDVVHVSEIKNKNGGMALLVNNQSYTLVLFVPLKRYLAWFSML